MKPLLLLPLFLLAAAAQAAERPNIVYILLDDAGYGDLSCQGQTHFQTPNIDRLANEGLRFTQHYSGSTVCAPTRCSLMTGKHTGHTHIRGNREMKPEGQEPLPADAASIPRLLKKAGYATGAFGKWGLGGPGSVGDPAEHFDLFYGYNCQREAHTYYPDHLWKNRERVELDGKTYSHDLIMGEALGFIRQHKDQPFFVFLPVTIPHAALQVPESYVAPFRAKFPQGEGVTGKYAGTEIRNPLAAFAGMMTKVDESVGQVLALLKELNLDEKTLVMLSSDNGPHTEGGHDPEFFKSSGPFKGVKRDMYEGGIHNTLLARWPGTIAPKTESGVVSAHWDMLPTFCDLAGAETPGGIDGISLSPTLLGKPEAQKAHDYLYWEFYEKGGRRAARFGNWKALQLELNRPQPQPIEIYDLASDPGETQNLAAQKPDLVARAEQIFKDAHAPSELWKFGPQPKK